MPKNSSESWRWQLLRENTPTDVRTGIDRRVLEVLGEHHASSHSVFTPDGTRLSYKRFGSGDRHIVFCNGLGGTYRTFADVFAVLLPEYTITIFDYRGLFESGEPSSLDTLTIEECARDVFTVMDHAEVERATLFGWSMGVQVSLEAFRQNRSRVDGLILASGVDGRLLDTVLDAPALRRVVPSVVRGLRNHGGAFMNALARTVQRQEVKRAARALRLVGRNADVTMEHAALLFSSDPQIYWGWVEALHEHDARDMLRSIDVPTLILHGDSDVLTPVRRGRSLRTEIRDSEIWVFAGCTHAVILEYPERVARHVREFYDRRIAGQH